MRLYSIHLKIACFCSAIVLQATSLDTTRSYPVLPGAKALQFRIGYDFSLSHFQGSLISYQKQLTRKKARRIGISFSTYLSTGEGSSKDNDYNSLDSTYNTSDVTYNQYNSNTAFSLSLQKINYNKLKLGVSSYYGLGPTCKFSYAFSEVNPDKDDPHVSRSKNIKKSFYIGLSFVMGVEWFFKGNMSILAEYRPSVLIGYISTSKHRKSFDSSGSYQIWDNQSKGPTFNVSSGVKYGLSVYF